MGVFLTVAGVDLDVLVNTGFEDEPDLKGGVQVMDDNTWLASARDAKRKFGCVVRFRPPSAYDTFLATAYPTGLRLPITVTSGADGMTRGATLTMWLIIGKTQIKSKGAGASKTTVLDVPFAFREA